MRSKKRSPVADMRTGLECQSLAAIDIRENSATRPEDQARRALDEMVANGATFTIPRRADGLKGFLYSLPRGGDIKRCRSIIQEAKARGFYDQMVQTITESAAPTAGSRS